MTQNEISLAPKCEFRKNGLIINNDMKFNDWIKLGGKLRTMNGAIHFWIGDWLNFGERKYGETYSQAMSETDYKYQTLANDKWVARKIAISRRRESLSFDHHAIVAEFEPEDQEMLLDKAENMGLDRSKFRKLAYQYRLRLDLPELTEQQIAKAQEKHPDFDLVQTVVTHGANLLDNLDKIEVDKLETNARDYLISCMRDVVAKVGAIVVKYDTGQLHPEVE